MTIERTQEDINQDIRIDILKQRVDVLEHDRNDAKMKLTFLQQQLDAHAKRFDLFEPLKHLIEHVDTIKALLRGKSK